MTGGKSCLSLQTPKKEQELRALARHGTDQMTSGAIFMDIVWKIMGPPTRPGENGSVSHWLGVVTRMSSRSAQRTVLNENYNNCGRRQGEAPAILPSAHLLNVLSTFRLCLFL